MKDVKVSKDCYIPKRNIKYYVGYNSHSVIEDVKSKKKEGKVIQHTNGKKTACVIYLKSGEIVTVNTSLETINARMNNAEKD